MLWVVVTNNIVIKVCVFGSQLPKTIFFSIDFDFKLIILISKYLNKNKHINVAPCCQLPSLWPLGKIKSTTISLLKVTY